MKHKDKRDPKDWKGMKFAIPFDYSMHNYLLRYYLAEHGLDPDTDVQLRSVPPPEMVANLRADNIDGFRAPTTSASARSMTASASCTSCPRRSGTGHPCCSFAASREFITRSPNSFAALTRAIVDATAYASKAENRKQIAEAIAPANYINAPVTVLEQVLTGTYADGLGGVKTDAKRVDFDPFPWQSFAVWMLTQMKRWGQIKGDGRLQGGGRAGLSRHRHRQGDGRDGADAAGDGVQIVLGDGQDFRSGKSPTIISRVSRSGRRREGADTNASLPVVPANAGTHTPRPSFRHAGGRLRQRRAAVAMGPGVRRDDLLRDPAQ